LPAPSAAWAIDGKAWTVAHSTITSAWSGSASTGTIGGAGTRSAAAARALSRLRAEIAVSRASGMSPAASRAASARPTVPKPASATRIGFALS
jgi:hypothetical protein